MKKTENSQEEFEMLPEYDFTGKKGTRGKYHQTYRKGHEARIYKGIYSLLYIRSWRCDVRA